MNKQDKIETILQSLQHAGRPNVNPFLATRVQAVATASKSTNIYSRLAAFLKQPVIAVCFLIMVIAANAFAYFYFSDAGANYSTTLNTQRNDFAITETSLFDQNNTDQ